MEPRKRTREIHPERVRAEAVAVLVNHLRRDDQRILLRLHAVPGQRHAGAACDAVERVGEVGAGLGGGDHQRCQQATRGLHGWRVVACVRQQAGLRCMLAPAAAGDGAAIGAAGVLVVLTRAGLPFKGALGEVYVGYGRLGLPNDV